MKKYLQLLCLFITMCFFSQTKYFEFTTNSKIGLVSSDGEEIIPASFKYSDSYNNRAFVFRDYDKNVFLFFNTATQKKQSYESIDSKLIYVKNKEYLLGKKKDKSYLVSIDDGTEIPLKEKFYNMQNNGKYILGNYSSRININKPSVVKKNTTKQVSIGKTKIEPLPSIEEPIKSLIQENFIIIKDDGSFTPIFKTLSDKFIILYDLNNSSDDESPKNVVLIDLDEMDRKSFDYLMLRNSNTSKANSWTIYDSKLKKVKSFEANYDDNTVIYKAEKLLGKSLSTTSYAPPPSIGSGFGGPKKIYYPSLSKEIENGENVVYFLKSETEKTKLFSTSAEVELWERSSNVTVKLNDDSAIFYVDKNSLKVMFPQKYWDKYKMK